MPVVANKVHTTVLNSFAGDCIPGSPVTLGEVIDDSKHGVLVGGDVRQPIPTIFPRIKKNFNTAQSNIWVPSEIPLIRDRSVWNSNKLSEAEKHMFKMNISYLTASDRIVPDNIITSLLQHVANYEVKQYYLWQCAEEANHAESYLWILQSIGLDPMAQGEVFSLYQRHKPLVDKLNWNIAYIEEMHSLMKTGNAQEQAVKDALIANLAAFVVFEFLFFPSAFAQIFCLANRGVMLDTAEQYRYIWRDETMHANHGIWMLKQVAKELNVKQEKLNSIISEAVSTGVVLELQYAKESMPDGGVQGLTLDMYENHVRFVANELTQKVFHIPKMKYDTAEDIIWFSKFKLRSVDTNTFEGRTLNYQRGNLNFTEDWSIVK